MAYGALETILQAAAQPGLPSNRELLRMAVITMAENAQAPVAWEIMRANLARQKELAPDTVMDSHTRRFVFGTPFPRGATPGRAQVRE